MKYIRSILLSSFFLIALMCYVKPASAAGVTYTVCASGCDFTTLTTALTHPGISNDTIQMTAGYVFVPGSEATSLYVPNNITVEALPGADAFGDAAEAVRDFSYGSNTVMQNITFENVAFDASGQNNVKWLNNTISGAAESILVLTSTTNAEISGNTGLQNVRLQTADDVVISNNIMHCRYQQSCIASSIAGGGVDYENSASISSNVDITNNQIINYTTNSFGDYINLSAGENFNITGNTISSAVAVDDIYLTMVSFSNTEVYLANNYFIFPEKTVGANNGTWGINIRVNDGDMSVLAEHNTLIMRDSTGSMLSSSSCTGMYDDGTHASPVVSYEFRYNLCYSPSIESGGEGTGVNLSYVLGTIDFTFVNSYNGFANFSTLISDNTNTYTTLSGTTTTDDPILRTENVSITDNYDPVPMSRYFDVNGALDIGALSAARLTTYTIDDNCTVDYATCHSNNIQNLNKVLKNGDAANIGAGTYAPITLNGGLNDITVNGAGATTIFDANDAGSAVTLDGVSDSTISNIQVQDTSIITTTTYDINHSQFVHGLTAYDQAAMIGIPNAVLVMTGVPSGNTCPSDFWDADGKDITAIIGGATQPWNLYLVQYLTIRLTIFAPSNILSDADDILGCANPGEVIVDHFIPNIFTVSGGYYTFNTAAATSAGISVKSGDTTPPAITRTDVSTNNAGVMSLNSSGNTFSNLTFSDNSYGIVFGGTSANNVIDGSSFSGNPIYDVRTTSTGVNSIQDSGFTLSKINVANTGNINILYRVQATVTDGTSLNPVDGASVTVRDTTQSPVGVITTGITGVTPISSPILATVLTQGGPLAATSGGKNPFSFSASKTGYNNNSQGSVTISSTGVNVLILLSPASPTAGGGLYVPPKSTDYGISVSKTASPSVLQNGPENVAFSLLVRNTGNVVAEKVVVEDAVCPNYSVLSGDTNNDGKLGVSEIWTYRCDVYISETIKSTTMVSALFGSDTAVVSAEATVTVLPGLSKEPKIRLDRSIVPNVLPQVGGLVISSYRVTNIGDVPMHSVSVVDNRCSPVFGPQGDKNENNLLDKNEVWTYSCKTNLTSSTFHVVTARGSANGKTSFDYESGTLTVGGGIADPLEDGIGYYIVVAGDSLRTIASRLYGDGEKWRRLVELNVSRFPVLSFNPESIQVGWALKYDVPRNYSFELINQSPYPKQMKPNEVANVWIEVKNIGQTAWFNKGKYPVRLGSGSSYGNQSQQRDYVSEFRNSNWLSDNRPVNMMHEVIEPGWHTRFQFDIKAPSRPGIYKAYFTPVVDGVTWMSDIGIYWEVQVVE